jgi:hypothetical protein
MYARPSRRALSRRTPPISFFCSPATRYRSRSSGLSVVGIVMLMVGSSALGYIHRSRILDPKQPVETVREPGRVQYRSRLTRLTCRRGFRYFYEPPRFHVEDVAVYRNVIGDQRVVSDTHDILDDALGVIRECQPIDVVTFCRSRPVARVAPATLVQRRGLQGCSLTDCSYRRL